MYFVYFVVYISLLEHNMAIDITGITNENEFYTHHYLTAILENDLKDLFGVWKQKEDEEDIPQPHTLLRGLRKDFFAFLSRLERERDMEERLSVQREFTGKLLSVLGYEVNPLMVDLDDGTVIPVLCGINRADGSPDLWMLDVVDAFGEESDPFELCFCEGQYTADDDIVKALDIPAEEIITKQVFGRSEPPRWVMLISDRQLILLDRTKWHDKRLLRFDLREILDRRETSTLAAMAALLHRDSICPQDGMPLLDTLDENSHKHAFAVSEDLKYSLREAIELLGNEAVYYLREHRHEKLYGRDMAGEMTRECLRYMYRLLFLFYIEARPELGYLPTKSREYRKGYSIESLRDLENIKLTTLESQNGLYIHASINTLFDLLYNGFEPKDLDMFGKPDHHTFRIAPLKSHLFDPKQTPLLNRVKFRNKVLHKVIELMSLTRPKPGKKNRRGRISYAQLGINQLGAVYEALLSYQGFFAETDLYEVKKAGEAHNVLETAYFVKPEDLDQYTEDERVFRENGTLAKFEKGTFIYRLAGRDREKSASYYTPEVLTQCLVKYALKELLTDKTADDILALTVCEPAMGSAAFLNEAVNQLSKAYLDLKQKETGQTISHDAYPNELQKVKMYIADSNVYGVDMNPVAVELAEVSLWLNTIYEGGFVPWFGNQLVCGNSLIGARRQVFHESLLKKKVKTDPLWLDEVPQRVMPGDERENESVYHFLLPDKGMADYKDRVVKQMAAEQIDKINEWRKEFTKPFSKSEINQLKTLSRAVDKLWKKHVDMQNLIEQRTTDPLHVFGQNPPDNKRKTTTTEFKDNILFQELHSKGVRNSSPYRRLKLVMDYWCALWFWSIEKADLLPSRAEFLFDLTLILEGNLYEAKPEKDGQLLLFPETQPSQASQNMVDELGFVNVDRLCDENERLGLVMALSERYRFLHWELEFAELFKRRGGFDLVLGNPPWIKVKWKEGGILGDTEPLFILKNYSATRLAEIRETTINKHNIKDEYLSSFEDSEGTQLFLNSPHNYFELNGMQANLFKCFVVKGWYIGQKSSTVSFITDEGIYNDPKGGMFRKACYSRLTLWLFFENEKKLFQEVGNAKKYEISIYGPKKDLINFDMITNIYHPLTIDQCFQCLEHGRKVPGIKNEKNEWETRGHTDRIVQVDYDLLELFSNLYDEKDNEITTARLPIIHAKQVVDVLNKISKLTNRLRDNKDLYYSTVMFDETYAEQNGIISRDTQFPENIEKWIVSGPHFNICNPYFQTPKKICNTHRAYDLIDHSFIDDNYLPRTNYIPQLEKDQYIQKSPKVNWDKNNSVLNYYRMVHRKRLNPSQERTFMSSIVPPGVGHIHTVVSTCFKNFNLLLDITFVTSTVLFDFFVKTTGRVDFTSGAVGQIPILSNFKLIENARLRVLMLNALSKHYSSLWSKCWNSKFHNDQWGKNDKRLKSTSFAELSKEWEYNYGIRNDYQRRQTLIELDVLASLAMGIDLEELKAIYRIQFPIMQQYESDTWYDQNGRIVFTCSKGLPGVGFSRPEWNEIKDMTEGTVTRTITDDTLPGGPVERTITYEAPFDRCDREKDYEVVWTEFERRKKGCR